VAGKCIVADTESCFHVEPRTFGRAHVITCFLVSRENVLRSILSRVELLLESEILADVIRVLLEDPIISKLLSIGNHT